eukprot:CAMPEP_0117579382 /NCGR_PEP_ID=MMETSP0784-20121206/64584_1 /TAXON_ID=39447 /ORGANISM="" /LENGTH=131 /DNA_ID=CAMNT_0005379263 /DNA_START=42 /DNA_END=434 /DNA_ORIENTATION=+
MKAPLSMAIVSTYTVVAAGGASSAAAAVDARSASAERWHNLRQRRRRMDHSKWHGHRLWMKKQASTAWSSWRETFYRDDVGCATVRVIEDADAARDVLIAERGTTQDAIAGPPRMAAGMSCGTTSISAMAG